MNYQIQAVTYLNHIRNIITKICNLGCFVEKKEPPKSDDFYILGQEGYKNTRRVLLERMA